MPVKSMCFVGLMVVVLAGGIHRSIQADEPAQSVVARSKLTPPASDSTINEASHLGIKVAVMCREWHVWWGSPHGVRPIAPVWYHWDGLKRFGQFDATTTIEEAVPGLAWRRYLDSVGYPLLGPYEPSQPDIIRWQLETARNAGLACLHLHIWPSTGDDGSDFGPMPVLEKIFATAAKLGFPIGIHDEVMFRSPKISQAQTLESSIRRMSTLVKCYGQHPGWYKVNGMPMLYFQNWTKWLSAKDMRTLFEEVEKRSQPVYWTVEMGPEDEYLAIPQLRAYIGPGNETMTRNPPPGKSPHSWDVLTQRMHLATDKARQHGKRIGILVFSRFNNNNARGSAGHDRIDSENGRFYVESLRRAAALRPDFLVVTQWNDYEESAFLEPAWDFDGWNGDPYRYCRITAAAMNKPFTPAALPRREELDPWIRHKLFGDTQPGDMGPVIYDVTSQGQKLLWKWGAGSGDPASMRLVQQRLARWSSNDRNSTGLRLTNGLSADRLGTLRGDQELRFFVPKLVMDRPATVWLGVRATRPSGTGVRVNYRGFLENYRWDSHWERRHVSLGTVSRIPLADGEDVYWTPLHGAQFAGSEGDLTLRLDGNRETCSVRELLIWHPEMEEAAFQVNWQDESLSIPESIALRGPLVVVAYDKIGNAGLPRLFFDGKTLPRPTRDPMDLLTAE